MKINNEIYLNYKIQSLLAYISENWERVKKKDITIRDIIRAVDCRAGPDEIFKYVNSEIIWPDIDKADLNFDRKIFIAINQGIEIISICSDEYPALLREYGHGDKVYPPLVLYRLGRPIPDKPMVAVVGTRNPSDKGRELAREIGAELARRGYAVVTGFAKGIDEEAVNGAQDASGHIVGVLPWLYEDEDLTELANFDSLHQLINMGYSDFTVLSEHLIKKDSSIRSWLAMRNRIISGMSIAVIIPETRYKQERWGTRHQVKFGIKAGRKVLIMKPRVNDKDIRKGFSEFKKAGAEAVSTIDELIKKVDDLKEEIVNKQKIQQQTLDNWF